MTYFIQRRQCMHRIKFAHKSQAGWWMPCTMNAAHVVTSFIQQLDHMCRPVEVFQKEYHSTTQLLGDGRRARYQPLLSLLALTKQLIGRFLFFLKMFCTCYIGSEQKSICIIFTSEKTFRANKHGKYVHLEFKKINGNKLTWFTNLCTGD